MLIKIKNLKLSTIIGIHEWEKTIDRQIIINAEIETANENSLESDNIADTIDYDILTNKIKDLTSKNKFQLIEKMSGEIMKSIMEDKRIERCRLEIDKVGVIEGVDSFSVTIEQKR